MAQKRQWTIAKEKCWTTEKPYRKKTEINCCNIVLCMKKTFSAVDCERTWKVKKVEVEKLNEEAGKEVRVGKAK